MNLRTLSNAELVRQAEGYLQGRMPAEIVSELLYRLRRSVGHTTEASGAQGERTGVVTTGPNAPWVPFGKGEQQEITGNEIEAHPGTERFTHVRK